MPENNALNDEASAERQQNQKEAAADDLVVSNHFITIRQAAVRYTVTAGTIVLKEEALEDGKSAGEKAKASVFFVAYTRDRIDDLSKRPITFSFNGGPGSSSVWLHLGLLGPKRVVLTGDDSDPSPPYRLVNNEFSLLDVTDLVFVDPVSTGFSRAVPGEKPKDFHDHKRDVEWVGEFIRLYASRYKRWSSPKYLIGESYGTTRAASLAGYLQERHGMYFNGLMLISSVLNFQTVRFNSGNDLPYILFLPSYTATAWYHQRLSSGLQEDLGQTLDGVRSFAMGEYALALLQGAALPEAERKLVVQKLASCTGLSETFIERCNLRVDIYRFVKELLRDQGRTVGRLDSRFTGIDRDTAGEHFEFDPSYTAIQGPFSGALNDYIRGELGYENDLPYEILADLWQNWRYEDHQNQYLDAGETLRKAMSMNQNLKVFVANGLFDLATPFLATEYTFNHVPLDPSLRPNITMAYYDAGHMMYIHQPSLARLKDELGDFIQLAMAKE